MVDEAGDVLPAGTLGELQFTGWSQMVGYYGLPPEDQPFTPTAGFGPEISARSTSLDTSRSSGV